MDIERTFFADRQYGSGRSDDFQSFAANIGVVDIDNFRDNFPAFGIFTGQGYQISVDHKIFVASAAFKGVDIANGAPRLFGVADKRPGIKYFVIIPTDILCSDNIIAQDAVQ